MIILPAPPVAEVPAGERICPRCGVPFELGRVSCPDARPGDRGSCLVAHWGPRCPRCHGLVYVREGG